MLWFYSKDTTAAAEGSRVPVNTNVSPIGLMKEEER